MYILPCISVTDSPRNASITMENTGNYPVTVTAVAFYVIAAISSPGHTATTSDANQDAAAHTPDQTLTFYKPEV